MEQDPFELNNEKQAKVEQRKRLASKTSARTVRSEDEESTMVAVVHNSELDQNQLESFQKEEFDICEAEFQTQAPSMMNSESSERKMGKSKERKLKAKSGSYSAHIASVVQSIESRDREIYYQRLAAKEKLDNIISRAPEVAQVQSVYATSVWCATGGAAISEEKSAVTDNLDPRRLNELDTDKYEMESRRANYEVPEDATGIPFDEYEKYDHENRFSSLRDESDDESFKSFDYESGSQGSQNSKAKPRNLIDDLRRTKEKNARAYTNAAPGAIPVAALKGEEQEVEFEFDLSETFGLKEATRMLLMVYNSLAQNKAVAGLFLAMLAFQCFSSAAYAVFSLFSWVIQMLILIPLAKANFNPSQAFENVKSKTKRGLSGKEGKIRNLRQLKPKVSLWHQLLIGLKNTIDKQLGNAPDDRCAIIAAAKADVRLDFEVKKAYDEANRKLNSINHDYTQSQIYSNSVLFQFSKDLTEKRPYVRTWVNGLQEEYMLYDMGSSVNLVNEIVVQELEKKLGYTLARIPSTIMLETFAGNNIGQTGAVLLDITMGTFTVTLPFLIVASNTKSPLILGTRAIIRHQIVLDFWGRDQCYLRFAGDDKEIVKVELCDGVHPLYVTEDVECPVNSYVSAKVAFVAADGRKHNLIKRPGIVSKHNDCTLPFKMAEGVAAVDKHGVVTIPLRNTSESDIILPKYSIISNFTRLDPNQFIDISDDLDFHGMSDAVVINHCPCMENNSLIVVCDSQGEANLGERYVPRQLPDNPEGKGIMHYEDGVMYWIPDRKRGFDCFTMADFEETMMSHDLPLDRAYSVIYSNASLLTATFRKFWLDLNFEYKVLLRFSAAFDEIRSCETCHSSRLDFHYPIVNEAEKVADVVIYIPQNNIVPSDVYFAKNKEDIDCFLTFQGITFQLFKAGYQKILIFCHLPTEGVPDIDYALTRLMLQLKDRFPNSNLQIRTSIVEGSEAARDDTLSTAVHSALKRVKQRRSRYVTGQRKAKKQNLAKVEVIKFNPVIEGCKCNYCLKPVKSAKVSRAIYEGEFPRLTYTRPEQDAHVAAKLAEYRIHSQEYKDEFAEVGAIIAHDIRLKGPHTISAEAAISTVTINACSVDFTYTRAGKLAYEDPNIQEVNMDEIAPIGYDSQRLLPKQQKFNVTDPLARIPTTNMNKDCRGEFESLINDYHEKVISFDKRDFSLIRRYSLKLRLSKEESFYCRPFPLKAHESAILNEKLADLEMAGIICKANTDVQFVCNAFLVKKDAASKMALDPKDVSFRLVVDFRPLNKLIEFTTDRYNIYGCASLVAKIGELRQSDKGLFSVVDVSNFFASLPVEHNSRRFLGIRGFQTPVFTYVQSPLGLAHMPSIMGDLLERVLTPELKKHCLFHLDDVVLVSSADPEEHARLLRILFDCLIRLGVYVTGSKLQLFAEKITYLGVEITQDRVNVMESRKKYVKSLPFPSNKQQLATFLGIASFVQQHIDSYQILASVLTPLVGLKTPFILNDYQRKTIKIIQHEIEHATSLFLVVKNCPLLVSTDASIAGAGCMVSQLVNGHVQIIRFYSCKWNRSQTLGLHSTMRELLAILTCCYKLDYLLTGHDQVIILTDLKSLAFVCAYSMSQKNSVLHRYMARLFAMNLKFKLGWLKNDENLILPPDYMSRQQFDGEERFAYLCKFSHKFDDLKNPAFDQVRFPNDWYDNHNITMDEFRNHIITMLDEPENKSGQILKKGVSRVNPRQAEIPGEHEELLGPTKGSNNRKKKAHYADEFEHDGMNDLSDGLYEEACAVYVAAVRLTEASANEHVVSALHRESHLAGVAACQVSRLSGAPVSVSASAALTKPIGDSFVKIGPSQHNALSDISSLNSRNTSEVAADGSVKVIPGNVEKTNEESEQLHYGNILSSFREITTEEIRNEQLVYYKDLMHMFHTMPRDKLPARVRNTYVFLNNYVLAYYPANKRQNSKVSPLLLLSPRLALNVLALHHCMSHVAGSKLLESFNKQYYVKRKSYYASIIGQCCRTCLQWKVPLRKDYVPGRIKRYTKPYQAYSIDFFFLGSKERVNRRVTDTVLNIVDQYSHMCYAQIVPNNQSDSVIQALENFLAPLPAPAAFILSDNERSLNLSNKLKTWCRERDIKPLLSSAYVSTSNSLVEQSNNHLRKTIQRVQSTFGYDRWVDAFPLAKHILNSMERTYAKGTPDEFRASAIKLHTGIEPRDLMYALSNENRPIASLLRIRDECQDRLNSHYRQQEAALDKADTEFIAQITTGDICLLRQTPEDKNAPSYGQMAYRVVWRKKRTALLQPLDGGKARTSHVKHLKRLPTSELLKLLKPEVSRLYGQYQEFDKRHLPEFLRKRSVAQAPVTRFRAKKLNEKPLRRRDDPKGDKNTNSLGTYSTITSVNRAGGADGSIRMNNRLGKSKAMSGRAGARGSCQDINGSRKDMSRRTSVRNSYPKLDSSSKGSAIMSQAVDSIPIVGGDSSVRSTRMRHHKSASKAQVASRNGINRGRRVQAARVSSSVSQRKDLPLSPPTSTTPPTVEGLLIYSTSRNSRGRNNNNSSIRSTIRSPPAKSVKPAENFSKLGNSQERNVSFNPSVYSTPETALSPARVKQLTKAPKKPGPIIQRARKFVKRIFGQEDHLSPTSRISPPKPTRSRSEKRRQAADAAQRETWEQDPNVAAGYEGIDSFQHQASPALVLRRSGRRKSIPKKLKDFVVNIRGKKGKAKRLAPIPEEVAVVNFQGKKRRANRTAHNPRGFQQRG